MHTPNTRVSHSYLHIHKAATNNLLDPSTANIEVCEPLQLSPCTKVTSVRYLEVLVEGLIAFDCD